MHLPPFNCTYVSPNLLQALLRTLLSPNPPCLHLHLPCLLLSKRSFCRLPSCQSRSVSHSLASLPSGVSRLSCKLTLPDLILVLLRALSIRLTVKAKALRRMWAWYSCLSMMSSMLLSHSKFFFSMSSRSVSYMSSNVCPVRITFVKTLTWAAVRDAGSRSQHRCSYVGIRVYDVLPHIRPPMCRANKCAAGVYVSVCIYARTFVYASARTHKDLIRKGAALQRIFRQRKVDGLRSHIQLMCQCNQRLAGGREGVKERGRTSKQPFLEISTYPTRAEKYRHEASFSCLTGAIYLSALSNSLRYFRIIK